MATNNTSPSNPRAEKMGDVLDALFSGIAKTAANEPKFEPKLLVPSVECAVPVVPSEPARELLTEIMLADRWVCSVARLQRWRTVGEGPQYLKIVGKVLYRLKDIRNLSDPESALGALPRGPRTDWILFERLGISSK